MTEVQIIIKVPSENVSVSSGESDASGTGPAPESIEQLDSQTSQTASDGPPPTLIESAGAQSSSGSEAPEPENIEEEIEALWQPVQMKAELGNGKSWSNITPQQALKYLQVAQVFSYEGIEDMPLDFIHYAKEGTEFFLVRNTTLENVEKTCSFRVASKQPEIWDPVSGNRIPVSSFVRGDMTTQIKLAFEPEQAYFVVFKQGKTTPEKAGKLNSHHVIDGQLIENSAGESMLDLSSDWQVQFDEKWGGPAEADFTQLISWTEREEQGIRYYSGTGTYRKTFEFDNSQLQEGNKVYLSLEEIEKIARVRVNNQEAGVIWCKPYRVDITEFLQEGTNELQIEVANTWSNRLTGDAITGKQFTNTNITGGPEITKKNPWSEVPLIPSGLMGKVELREYNRMNR